VDKGCMDKTTAGTGMAGDNESCRDRDLMHRVHKVVRMTLSY
jgi:hypothetical protein